MPKRLSLSLIFILSTLFNHAAFALDATGHMIIAQIAYNNLTPVAKKDVNTLINNTSFAADFPTFTPYVYSAPWPDYANYKLQAPTGEAKGIFGLLRLEVQAWHFIDDPIVEDHVTPAPISPNNAVWAIHYLIPELTQLMKEKNYDSAAYALIFLTHIIGDLHQPLHAADLFDAQFPNGDHGGNDYKIKLTYGANELHALWDKSLGRFQDWKRYGYRPTPQKLVATAYALQGLCRSVNNLDPASWEKESYTIAHDFVYPIKNLDAPKPGQAPSDMYIVKGREIAAQQMCLAGKRLAAVLNKVLVVPIA